MLESMPHKDPDARRRYRREYWRERRRLRNRGNYERWNDAVHELTMLMPTMTRRTLEGGWQRLNDAFEAERKARTESRTSVE